VSLLSKWVFDPIKKLITSAKIVPELLDMATQAEAIYVKSGPQGVTTAILDNLEGGLQVLVDDAVTAAMSNLGPLGVALDPEALKGANDALAYIENHVNAVVGSLFSHATATVAAQAAPPATPAA
jgi:hypothetical protein